MERNRRLALAESSFKEALLRDPTYALAEIRLGRIQYLRDNDDAARATITSAEKRTQEPGHLFLAAMFLGAIHQRQADLDAARACFERALAIVPNSQAAVVALAYIESSTGRPDRAQALARAFAASTTANDRFWGAYKNGGLDEPGLSWLRRRVWK